MSLKQYSQNLLPAIERELQEAVNLVSGPKYQELLQMMNYHMGWNDVDGGSPTSGKRIRPLLLLLTAEAVGGKWEKALPAAASVELIHNFSLIHDDIEDNSPLRRGRPTVWTKWGIPQAINTGDSMYALAHLAMLRLASEYSAQTALKAAQIIQSTSLKLTQGQFLDISYENQENLTIDDYWKMVSGKTASLLSACSEIGALVGGTDENTQLLYQKFGLNLGLAFQVLDDYLGIWGDSEKIGKSKVSDLIRRKKSLPILFGLEKHGRFAERWECDEIDENDVPIFAEQLESEGARGYTKDIADKLTKKALDTLETANPQGDAGKALRQLAKQMLSRDT